MTLYFMGTGDLKSAEVEALNAFNLNLADSENGRLLGEVYEKRNVPALAIDAYEKVLLNPQVKPTAQFMHTLGLLYQKDGRYNEARDRYVKAVEIDSTYAPALGDLAGLLRSAKQYDKAAKVYIRYLEHDPNNLDAQIGLIESCLEAGYNAQALTSATTAMQLDSTRVDVRLLYARAGLRSKDKAVQTRAAAIFAALPAGVGLKAEDYLLVGTQQLTEGQFEAARQNLERAIAEDSTLAEAHFQLGLHDLRTQDPDSAIVHIERAIRLQPKLPLYYVNLGVAQSQAKRFDKAVEAYQKAVDLDPRLVISHLLLAEALISSNNIDAAEAEYRKALEIEPQNARGLRGLGFISMKKGQCPEGVRFYKSSTQSDPTNADGWAGLGQAYLCMQDLAQAEAALKKAQSIDPNNPTVKKSLELLRARGTSGGK
jgi:tetratricopeptide (TPR) repeat protein